MCFYPDFILILYWIFSDFILILSGIYPEKTTFLFCCVLFLTEEAYSHGGLRTRDLGQNPFMLAWVTNVSTSPDLNIEFISTGSARTDP